MRRRQFVALMGASVAWPFAATAQEAVRTYRLGFLVTTPREANIAFFDELRRLGFIEGQNLTVVSFIYPVRRSGSTIRSRAG